MFASVDTAVLSVAKLLRGAFAILQGEGVATEVADSGGSALS